jgi:hypothetical protein
MKNRHVMIVGSQNVGGSEASYYLAQESGVRAVEMAIYSAHHALQGLGITVVLREASVDEKN